MKTNKEYFYLCRAIKEQNKYLATHFYREIRTIINDRPKHLYWFTKFMEKNGGYVKVSYRNIFGE